MPQEEEEEEEEEEPEEVPEALIFEAGEADAAAMDPMILQMFAQARPRGLG